MFNHLFSNVKPLGWAICQGYHGSPVMAVTSEPRRSDHHWVNPQGQVVKGFWFQSVFSTPNPMIPKCLSETLYLYTASNDSNVCLKLYRLYIYTRLTQKWWWSYGYAMAMLIRFAVRAWPPVVLHRLVAQLGLADPSINRLNCFVGFRARKHSLWKVWWCFYWFTQIRSWTLKMRLSIRSISNKLNSI